MYQKLFRLLKKLKKPKSVKTTIPKEDPKPVQPVHKEVQKQDLPEKKKKHIIILINKKDTIEEELSKEDVKKISKNFSVIFEKELDKLLEKEKSDSQQT